MKKIILVITALLCASVVNAQETNILLPYNGGFENGMANWRFFEVPNNIGSTAEITTADVTEGLKAFRVTFVTDDGTVVDRGFDNWDARVPVITGADYTAKVMAKIDGSEELYLNLTLGYFDANSVFINAETNQIQLSNVYSDYSVTNTAPTNAQTCFIAFRFTNADGTKGEGTFYLDDVRLFGESVSLTPQVMSLTLPSDDVPIASINVTDAPFNAANDGSADATIAFQAAVDRAVLAGGGVVFIPAGKYRFDGNIIVREKVILRGEWQNPEVTNNNVVGTILMPFAGKGSETGEAFVSLEIGSGIKNLSIWYPNQSATSVTPYPFTILCNPETAKGAGDNTSVINVTLVNSYQGIKIGPIWNELHYIRNVYGMPLKTGIWLSQTTDIGRIMNVHFEPKYWSSSGLLSSPSENAILNWTQNNGTGIIMGRSDWEYIYDVSLVGYETGIQIIKYSDIGPNGVIYGLNIDKSKIGINLSNVNHIGWAITNSTINVEGENSSCVITGDDFTTIVQFNTCTFGGSPKTAIQFSKNSIGRLSFQNCTFENWGETTSDAAIDCEKGSVSLIGNIFTQDKLHFRFGEGVKNSQILDNKFPQGLKIENNSEGEIIISQEPLGSAKLEVPPHIFAAEPLPQNDDLFLVQDYGAIADGTDNTSAFQTALDAAKLNGGGTVYFPAGMYRLNGHLTVPNGVELRGMWDVPHHTTSKGSVLLVYEGKNNPGGIPFISLETGAGVRGFTVWYPEQNTNDFPEYPWSIQTQGDNCWIKDVTLGNTWQGADLASYPSSGHVISYLAGSPLKAGLSVSQNLSDGWIENVQFNPHYWLRSSGYPKVSEPEFNPLVSQQQSYLNAFKIGTTNQEHILGTFVFASNRGLYLADDGGTTNANIFLHGSDAASNGIYIESKNDSKINFINSQLVLLGNSQNGIITTDPGFDADVSFYNNLSWGEQNGFTTDIKGVGDLLVQQLHTMNGAFNLDGGNTRLENIVVSSTLDPQYIISENASEVKIFDSYSNNGFKFQNNSKSNIEFDYNFKQSLSGTKLKTGWEDEDIQNDWDNMLWGNKNIKVDSLIYKCLKENEKTHSGDFSLRLLGNKINESDTLFYKILKLRIPVFDSSVLSYWANPQNEMGRSIFVDVLFSDGTRLSELSPVAEDGFDLSAERGTINEWSNVICNIGNYASGKYTETILVGSNSITNGIMDSYIDDFELSTPTSLKEPWNQIDIGKQIFEGYSNFNNESLSIYSACNGLSSVGDEIVFAYQKLEMDCEISVRLESVTNIGFNPYVGVMVRQSDSTTSRFVSLLYSPLIGGYTKWRTPTTNSIHSVVHREVNKELPKWLKISRKGSEFKTYTSIDGMNWGSPLYSLSMEMDSTVMIGLVTLSGQTTAWMKTEFSNIIVSDEVVGVEKSNSTIPSKFQLYQNHPNPFNPSTKIIYDLAKSGMVSLSIYDALGRKVADLINKTQNAGRYSTNWDASNLSSGIYFYRFEVTSPEFKEEVVFSKKMILLK